MGVCLRSLRRRHTKAFWPEQPSSAIHREVGLAQVSDQGITAFVEADISVEVRSKQHGIQIREGPLAVGLLRGANRRKRA